MAGNSGVKVSDVVWVNLGQHDFLTFVQKGEHDVKEGDGVVLKATVQDTDGKPVNVGYREPTEGSDKGLTFWLV